MKIIREDDTVDLQQTLLRALNLDAAVWTLGRLFSNPASGSVPMWGLFIFDTDSNLHFVCFEQDNWYSMLLNSAMQGSKKSKNGIRYHAEYARAKWDHLENVTKRGFFSRLMKPFPLYHLYLNFTEEHVIFELEDPSKEFLDFLENDS